MGNVVTFFKYNNIEQFLKNNTFEFVCALRIIKYKNIIIFFVFHIKHLIIVYFLAGLKQIIKALVNKM